MIGLDASQLQNFTTFGALVPILVGLVVVKFVASTIVRTVALALALALGALVFLQRNEIDTCVENARQNLEAEQTRITCSLLGFDIDLDI